MRWPATLVLISVSLSSSGCGVRKSASNPAEPAGPHFATLCMSPAQWPELIKRMNIFASMHALEFHGGVDHETLDGKPQLNAFVAQDYSYYFGDGFDVWFVSNPFNPRVIDVNGILKHKPISSDQTALATALLAQTRDITKVAGKSAGQPSCGEASTPPNVR